MKRAVRSVGHRRPLPAGSPRASTPRPIGEESGSARWARAGSNRRTRVVRCRPQLLSGRGPRWRRMRDPASSGEARTVAHLADRHATRSELRLHRRFKGGCELARPMILSSGMQTTRRSGWSRRSLGSVAARWARPPMPGECAVSVDRGPTANRPPRPLAAVVSAVPHIGQKPSTSLSVPSPESADPRRRSPAQRLGRRRSGATSCTLRQKAR
jgi:hypothetical protein